jgi:hypothetical protein
MKFIIPLTLVTLLLQACSSLAPEKPAIVQQGRVGIIDLLSPQYTHTHVGTTAFNNYVEPFNAPWDARSFLEKSTLQTIESSGALHAVVITPSPTISSYFATNDKIDDNIGPALDALASANHVQMLVVLRTVASGDPMGHTSAQIDGYGLYTRSFLGKDHAFAYAMIHPIVIQAAPARKVSATAMWTKVQPDGVELVGFPFPDDFHVLQQPQFDALKDGLKQVIYQEAALVAKEIYGGAP